MSTAFRVTQRTVTQTMMGGLQANFERLQKIQEQLSSGKQISRPSDGPVQTAEAMQFRSQIRRAEQYVRNADDGVALLGTADTALTNSLDMTRRVRDLTLIGLNASTSDQAKLALAAEIDTLRESLVGIANTRYLDRPVFGGNAAGSTAYTTPGGVYTGDAGAVVRTIGSGTQVEVNVAGPDVFGQSAPGGTQLFDVLRGISAALRGQPPSDGVTSLDDGLTKLDTASNRIITALGSVGARFNRVDTMRTRAENQILDLTSGLSNVEDIDLPRTIVDLQMQEVAYKAALGATARVVQPSLLDFLR